MKQNWRAESLEIAVAAEIRHSVKYAYDEGYADGTADAKSEMQRNINVFVDKKTNEISVEIGLTEPIKFQVKPAIGESLLVDVEYIGNLKDATLPIERNENG